MTEGSSDPLPENFSYDPKTFAREEQPHELPASFAPLYHSFAFESNKRSNLHYLDEDGTVVFCAGGIVHFLDVSSMTTSYLLSPGGNEVGCVEVHTGRQLLCVAEKGTMPNAFIYEYPSLSLARVLKGGTERAYSAAHFSADGEKLATVGSFPDYMLTVWDWNREQIILRTKAFSQEVYRVRFSPRFEGQLVTSGTGHIRFWRMAQTFTGLKLQGDIGKFGQVELSDIEGFCELPDGKVLSGSDWGNLLLWEGNLIKCEIKGKFGHCHAGAIHAVNLAGSEIITGGHDGYVRAWPLAEIESAEPTDDMPIFEATPSRELCLLDMEKGRTVSRIQTMIKGDSHWLVQDAAGGVYKVSLETKQTTYLFSFHAGAITGLDLCPFNHAAATCGADGSVRLWDYVAKAPICVFRSPAAATTISWAGRSVDPEGRTLIAGYSDGVVRVLTRCKDGLALRTAFKPHTVPIAAIAYSANGAYLASGAADGSVFFITVRDGVYAPLALMAPPPPAEGKGVAAITTLAWATDDALYAGYSDGSFAELVVPLDVDTSETYETAFNGQIFDDTPMVEYRRAEARAAKAAASPPKDDAPAPAEEPSLAGTDAPPEDEPEPEPDFDPGAVSAILPLKGSAADGRKLLLSYAKEPGTIWRCTWGEGAATPVRRHDAPVVHLALSRSSTYLLSGGADGSVCVGEEAAAGEAYWQGRVHGASRSVTSMLSFDDSFLVSAGADGNLFVHQVTAAEQKDHILSAIGLPEVSQSGTQAADITEASTYSIEQAKQKSESDARAAAAEEAKLSVRDKITRLRKRFIGLLAENEQLPPAERLPREAFFVDPGLKEQCERETQARLEEARAELAWASERAALSRSKLENHYLRHLAVESIKLDGFQNKLSVRSFRTVELEQWQREAMEHVHALIDKEQKQRQRTTRQSGDDGSFDNNDDEGEGEAAPAAEKDGDEKVSKMQARMLRRQARAKQWAEFNATKPDEKYEDPVDVANIHYAESHMGDFSLKTDEDYVVPETQRVNAQKKRRQIVLLDESIHAIKMGFNERFLALRDLKRRLIDSMKAEDTRLHEIAAELGEPTTLPPSLATPDGLLPYEQPELRSVTTAEERAAFKEEKAAAAAKAKGGMGGGMSGGGSKAAASLPTAPPPPAGSSAAAARTTPAPKVAVSERAGGMSDFEKEEIALRRRKLEVERDLLIERRRTTIGSFDDALAELRAEKLKLEADLKTTDLRKLELALLKEFEKKDTTLAKRLESKHTEKAEIVARVAETQEKLAQKKTEIERLLDRDRQIMAEFNQALGENNKFYDALFKIFKKKIKRKKQMQGDEDDDEDEEEDSEDDDDFEEEEEEEETSPAGCDPALYDKVCELREKRLEQEEVYTEFQKGVEALKKENDILIKKEKVIDKALKDTEADIQAFQTEKQGKLNELLVVVTLQMSQVRHLDEQGRLPADLSKVLVFPSAELDRLRNRIKQLGVEKADLRRRQKTLRTEHATLRREQATKADKLRELEARARDVQMLKFGQLIDLERLESAGVNKPAEELREKIKSVERTQQATLASWVEKLEQAKQDLKAATEESTVALNTVASLFERQHTLETSLNSKQAAVAPKEASAERKERTSLVQLVKIQAKEVEALKLEINMLRRKGGHVYTGGK